MSVQYISKSVTKLRRQTAIMTKATSHLFRKLLVDNMLRIETRLRTGSSEISEPIIFLATTQISNYQTILQNFILKR